MIFVTVGTHEQPFDRLVSYMDRWAGIHDEEVVIQSGFATYVPLNCKWKRWFLYREMIRLVSDARLVITHGGASSFFMALQVGKVPIVVPRRREYREHVNNHQVVFCNWIAQKQKCIIVVDNIRNMDAIIGNYEKIVRKMGNEQFQYDNSFCTKLGEIVEELVR